MLANLIGNLSTVRWAISLTIVTQSIICKMKSSTTPSAFRAGLNYSSLGLPGPESWDGFGHDDVHRLRQLNLIRPLVQEDRPILVAIVITDGPGQLDHRILLHRVDSFRPSHTGKVS